MALGSNTPFYETPNHPYQDERIAEESGLLGKYGLKNKEELWRAESELRQYRREARNALGEAGGDESQAEAQRSEFVARLQRLGILDEQESLADVLSLEVTDILERRLQSVVYRKGLANSVNQARQLISHGHITVDGARVQRPSYKMSVNEENAVAFDETSPLSDELHPERAEGQ